MIDLKCKNHINILNLMSKIEERFKNQPDWRVEQYLKSLLQMLNEEECKNGKLTDELIAVQMKAKFFNSLLEAKTKKNLLEQYDAINKLSHNFIEINNHHPVQTTKTIHLTEIANYEKRIRDQLFQKNENKYRKFRDERKYDDIIKYHQLLQDQVTTEMVDLVRNLKQNCVTSNEIVKKDTEKKLIHLQT
ncbi:hypothetical protein SSS_00259 [Sarcoptes scabiei]|nr:hypothetical protein SSS_00259 [Sarcoptes scabiei]